MLKLSARIFDIYDDQTGEIASQLGAEYADVKLAGIDEVSELADSQFGLILKTANGLIRRRYPLHDADSLKLSRAYFDKVKGSLPDEIASVVESKIASFEAGKPDHNFAYVDVAKISDRPAKVAFSEKHWGLNVDGRDMFPLHDADLVKTAITRFNGTVETLEPEETFLYARNIAKRAADCNVAVPATSNINLYTNDEVNLLSLKIAIEERHRILKAAGASTEILDQLELAAGCQVTKGEIESQDSYARRTKFASKMAKDEIASDPAYIISILQTVDKLAGIGRDTYLRGLLDPFAACFKSDAITKRAAMVVDGIDLSCVTPEALAAKFDPEFCAQFANQPVSSYQGLPTQLQDVVKQMAQDKSHTCGGGTDPVQRLDPTYVNSIALGS